MAGAKNRLRRMTAGAGFKPAATISPRSHGRNVDEITSGVFGRLVARFSRGIGFVWLRGFRVTLASFGCTVFGATLASFGCTVLARQWLRWEPPFVAPASSRWETPARCRCHLAEPTLVNLASFGCSIFGAALASFGCTVFGATLASFGCTVFGATLASFGCTVLGDWFRTFLASRSPNLGSLFHHYREIKSHRLEILQRLLKP